MKWVVAIILNLLGFLCFSGPLSFAQEISPASVNKIDEAAQLFSENFNFAQRILSQPHSLQSLIDPRTNNYAFLKTSLENIGEALHSVLRESKLELNAEEQENLIKEIIEKKGDKILTRSSAALLSTMIVLGIDSGLWPMLGTYLFGMGGLIPFVAYREKKLSEPKNKIQLYEDYKLDRVAACWAMFFKKLSEIDPRFHLLTHTGRKFSVMDRLDQFKELLKTELHLKELSDFGFFSRALCEGIIASK